DQVERAVLARAHEPGARTRRHALGGPLLERGAQGLLCELLSRPDVADETSQPGDEPGRLDPPYRLGRAMRFGCRCLAAPWTIGRGSSSQTYGERSFTCPRIRGPDGPRRYHRNTVPA